MGENFLCNLYSITTNQAAIIALLRVMNRYVGNLPSMPGVFPDYPVRRGHTAACSGISARCEDRNPWRALPFLFVVFATGQRMKILEHPESYLVKLDDGSTWQIFPGDIDLTLAWLPTTELRLFEINDEVASHALINSDDGSRVRVRPRGEEWPIGKLKDVLKQG
jgi:hypothetical protein